LEQKQEKKGYIPLHSALNENQLKELAKIFNKYKGLGIDLKTSGQDVGDAIQGNGSLSFQTDLGITQDDDPGLMIIAWKLGCCETWIFSRDEWMEGWTLAGCHTVEQMIQKLMEWNKELTRDNELYKLFYGFVFNYLRGEKKVLTIDESLLVWEMLLKPKKWQLYEKWLEFLRVGKEHKVINKDEWQQLIEFVASHPKDVTNYDEMAAWPLVFDEFVDYMKGGKKEPDEKEIYDD